MTVDTDKGLVMFLENKTALVGAEGAGLIVVLADMNEIGKNPIPSDDPELIRKTGPGSAGRR